MAKQWDKLAAKARKIAKNIVTGEEEYKGTRLTAIVYRLDTFGLTCKVPCLSYPKIL